MTERPKRFLTYPELRARKGIPYTRQHLSKLEKRGLFPRRALIGLKRVGWFEAEIDAYLEAAATARVEAA